MAKTLNNVSSLPQMNAAFSGWTMPIEIIIITQDVIDGFPIDIEKKVSFKGVIQPLSPRMIELKPEGQRSFEWLQIHCQSKEISFEPNARICYAGKRYKIMANNDYSLNNYSEYHAVRDYQDGNP